MVNIDKLEMDKGGKFKLEASSNKFYPGLNVEWKAAKPQDFVGEVTYSAGIATCGVKFSKPVLSGAIPDFGLRLLSGPFFCSLLAKDKLDTLNATALYTVNSDIKCAAACNYAVKAGNAGITVGMAYKGLYKVKVSHDQSVSCSAKHHLAKGFSLLGGAKYSMKKGDFSYGLQLSIE